MKKITIISGFIILAVLFSMLSRSQDVTPFFGVNGGYCSSKALAGGFEFGAEWQGILIGADVRLQSSSQPGGFGGKVGWFAPIKEDRKQAFSLTGGAYLFKRNNHTKYHVSEFGATITPRYYFYRFFFVEAYYLRMEERNYFGGGVGITGWCDK